MPRTRLPLPFVNRSTAIALAGVALVILVFPQSCYAEPPASGCDTLAVNELRDAAGEVVLLVHARCGAEDRVDLCDGETCEPDLCAPAGVTVAGELGSLPLWDGWLEPPMPLPGKNGAQDLLLVRRLGNGGYPHIVRYSLEEGRPVCSDINELDAVISEAASSLGPEESFGFRGSRVEIVSDRLVLTRGIYLAEDPNCCPSGGFARLWTRLRSGQLELLRVDRVPPSSKS